MDKYEKTFELIDKHGMNWTADKLPLTGPDGQPTKSYGMFRSDGGGWLGTVGEQYVPVQNHELATLVIEAAGELGYHATNAGVLQGGRRVFVQVAMPQMNIGMGGVDRYITAMNSHDGSSAVAFGTTSTVLKCQNQWNRMFYKSGLTKVIHSSTAGEKLRAIMQEMKAAMDQEAEIMNHLQRMAEIKTTAEQAGVLFERIVKKFFDVGGSDEVEGRKKNNIVKLGDAMVQEAELEGANLWAMFNGVTRYTNHMATKRSREDYVMVGAGAKMNNAAYDIISEWLTEHGAKTYAMN